MLCRICNQDEKWHKDHRPRHAYSPDSTLFRKAGEMPARKLPSDPVLRLVLIRKGVISGDDLSAVEKELESAGVIVVEPGSGGEDRADRADECSEGGVRHSGSRQSDRAKK